MSSSQDWFVGDQPTNERDWVFVQTLRTAALAWTFADLKPEDTLTAGEDIGRLVEIRVPLLTTSRRILRVCYDVDLAGRPSLQSEWTPFAYAFEGLEFDSPDFKTELC